MMIKKYKHISLNWVVGYVGDGNYKLSMLDGDFPTSHTIPREIVENGNDWKLIEEEKETDWIDEVLLEFQKHRYSVNWNDLIRQAIEKHMPKITECEIGDIITEQDEHIAMVNLAKHRGLLKD